MATRIHILAKHLSTASSAPVNSTAIVYASNGPISKVLSIVKYTVEALKDNEVLLKILAAPVNPADINIIEGTYPVKSNFGSIGAIAGNEGVCEIIGIGQKVSGYKMGDWVISSSQSSYGTWQTYTKSNAEHLLKLPNYNGISHIMVNVNLKRGSNYCSQPSNSVQNA
jgi:trans-2-enoyl-CoA reductase